jgi:serralysin
MPPGPSNGGRSSDTSGFGLADGAALAMTIWDSGVEDTIDAQNQSGSVKIDLRPGEYSSIGALRDSIGLAAAVVRNGVIVNLIEKAFGGSSSDYLIGNQANNLIKGNGGDDTLEGGWGNDILYGGAGDDTAVFYGPRSSYVVSRNNDGSIQVAAAAGTGATDGTDTLHEIEKFKIHGPSNAVHLSRTPAAYRHHAA